MGRYLQEHETSRVNSVSPMSSFGIWKDIMKEKRVIKKTCQVPT